MIPVNLIQKKYDVLHFAFANIPRLEFPSTPGHIYSCEDSRHKYTAVTPASNPSGSREQSDVER